jgi:hypothetical protein
LRRADYSSKGVLQTAVCPVSVIAKPRRGKPWPGMRSNRQGGGGALVQKPHKVKKEETGTDSYGVCGLKMLGWHWFRITLESELCNSGIGCVKLLAD